MYILFIVLILIASVLLTLTVLAQNPKSGMAANFGASNQVMGVRQTADFLEKMTWGLSISIVVLSLCATMAMPSEDIEKSTTGIDQAIKEQAQGNINFDAAAGQGAGDQAPAVIEVPATDAPIEQ